MNELREWTSTLCDDLGLDADQLAYGLILSMARDVGRTVAKPAAPITVYLVGMAVARGLSPMEAAARVGQLTARWPRVDWRD